MIFPDQVHYVSEDSPNFVIQSNAYRMTASTLVKRGTPAFNELQDNIRGEHRRDDAYALFWLESEEHTILHVTSPDVLARYEATREPLDLSTGVNQDRWPHSGPWEELAPKGFWNEGGEGIVSYLDHPERPSGIVVYEYLGHKTILKEGDPEHLVTFHCTVCHAHSGGDVFENTAASRRRWVGRKARQHASSVARHGVGDFGGNSQSECRPMGADIRQVIATVTDTPYSENASDCAAYGPCATIRNLKAKELNQ